MNEELLSNARNLLFKRLSCHEQDLGGIFIVLDKDGVETLLNAFYEGYAKRDIKRTEPKCVKNSH